MTANRENIQKWIDALRSGEYKQGKGRLKYSNQDGDVKHCCLGVACEVALVDGVGLELTNNPMNIYTDRKYFFDGYGESIPPKVQKWLGVDDDDPRITEEYSAAGLNDSGNYTFSEIADLLEEKYING